MRRERARIAAKPAIPLRVIAASTYVKRGPFRRASPLLPVPLGLLPEPEPFADLRDEAGHGTTLTGGARSPARVAQRLSHRGSVSRFRQRATAPLHLPDLRTPFPTAWRSRSRPPARPRHSPSRAGTQEFPGSASAGRSLFAFRLLWRAAPRSRRLPLLARGRAPGRSQLREAFALSGRGRGVRKVCHSHRLAS